MAEVMKILGLDLSDDSLVETPRRIAKMYVQELFAGLKTDTFPKATTVENKMQYGDLIIEKCTVKSVCEHHFVYFGTAHNTQELGCWIAYIPKQKVLGLSKLNRITNYFARRPQIQERLTGQIAHALRYILDTEDVAVAGLAASLRSSSASKPKAVKAGMASTNRRSRSAVRSKPMALAMW